MLLPVLLCLMAILMQPVCLLYTKAVMRGTASEVARVLTTWEGDPEQVRAYALRRLRAVPEVSVFHVGGEGDWRIVTSGGGSEAHVLIEGHARPLPLMGTLIGALGESDGEGVVLRVSETQRVRPGWWGGDYADWIGAWDG